MAEAFMRRRGSYTRWNKYNAVKQIENTYRLDDDLNGSTYEAGVGPGWSVGATACGTDYEWKGPTPGGWELINYDIVNPGPDLIGKYVWEHGAHYVLYVTDAGWDDEGGWYIGTYVAGEQLVSSRTYYIKGTTSFGVVRAKEGVYPGTGTLYSGSIEEGWCVMLEGSTYYYYEIA